MGSNCPTCGADLIIVPNDDPAYGAPTVYFCEAAGAAHIPVGWSPEGEARAAAQLLEAFNVVFESLTEGDSRAAIVERLTAETARRGLTDVAPEFLEELAEAVEDRTPVWFGP